MQPAGNNLIRVGMVGLGMIFDETYRPLFEQLRREGIYRRTFGPVDVHLAAVASRTGVRGDRYLRAGALGSFVNCSGPAAVADLLAAGVDVACIATPDDRHFEAARVALLAGKHVLIEKPSVLRLDQLDELTALARAKGVLAKVVYHKLADPDHKKLRTHVVDGVLQHVNNGYCSLLEPRSISSKQFAEWIEGRNPATYVAVHYIKLIDFTFASAPLPCRLCRVSVTGQRGQVGPADGRTWDSVQVQLTYRYPDRREAVFDIHTSWVTPDNFPGYVEQEVQFRFDNGVWNGHQRKRGVELTVEGRSPGEFKYTPNHHYNASFVEPWDERSQRGYGIEILHRFFEEVAFVEFGGEGDPADRPARLAQMTALPYNDLGADRAVVSAVQAIEEILALHADGQPGAVALVDDDPAGGLVLRRIGSNSPKILYSPRVLPPL